LEAPRLRWKYAWIKPLFGWDLAKRAQIQLPEIKASLMRSWDRVLYEMERSGRDRF
jgi:hypothetical protein